MDSKLDRYQSLIKQILAKYLDLFNRSEQPGVESMTIFDDERGHYMLETVGWANRQRIWNTTVYVRLREGKFWIEIDWTEAGIATELLDAGVPKEDIVLAFHHPSMRPYTEFAVA